MITTIEWTQQQPMPVDKAGAATAMVGTDLVLAGGVRWADGAKAYLDRTDVFDTVTKRWRAGTPLPVPMGYGPSCGLGGGLLAIGGTDGKRVIRDCWQMDHSGGGAGGGGWRHDGQFPEDCLVLGRAVAVGGAVVVFASGRDPDANNQRGASDGVFYRAAGSKKWERVSSWPGGPTCLIAGAVIGGCIYAFGGSSQNASGNFINGDAAYQFDPHTRRWTKLRPLPQAARGLAAVAVDDRFVALLGGYTAADHNVEGKPRDYGYSDAVWLYDVREDRYMASTPMPHPVMGMEAGCLDGVIYGAGGEPHGDRARTDRTLQGRIQG